MHVTLSSYFNTPKETVCCALDKEGCYRGHNVPSLGFQNPFKFVTVQNTQALPFDVLASEALPSLHRDRENNGS
jgi:hypothetical protein